MPQKPLRRDLVVGDLHENLRFHPGDLFAAGHLDVWAGNGGGVEAPPQVGRHAHGEAGSRLACVDEIVPNPAVEEEGGNPVAFRLEPDDRQGFLAAALDLEPSAARPDR
jgi:hypothetical protein